MVANGTFARRHASARSLLKRNIILNIQLHRELFKHSESLPGSEFIPFYFYWHHLIQTHSFLVALNFFFVSVKKNPPPHQCHIDISLLLTFRSEASL